MADELVKVSIYINEADQWNHRPLHLELLKMLYEEGIAGGTVLRGVAGFTHEGRVQTTSIVDAGGKLPLVIEFIDTRAHVDRVMPAVTRMAAHRLVVAQGVERQTGGAGVE